MNTGISKLTKNKLSRLTGIFRSRNRTAVLVMLGFGVIGTYLIVSSLAATGNSMSLVASSSNLNIGDTFTVTLHEDSGSDAVNAIQANLTYTSNLQYVSTDYSTGIFDIQAESTGGNGAVAIARGKTGGGITGDQIVAVITFRATASGAANVTFGCIDNGGSCKNGDALVRASDNANVLASQADGSYTIAGAAAADTTPPSVPTRLAVTSHAATSIDFSWSASTDDTAVTGYKIYRGGAQIGTSNTNTYSDSSLTASTAYTYTVSAYDAAGNDSAQSAGLQATTDAATPPASGTASLSLSPSSQSVAIGSNVTIDVSVNSGSTPINGVQSTISFPAGQFSYVSLTADPAFSAFPQPTVSNGKVTFGAGATAAISGTHTVATLTLKATSAGSGPLSLETICTGTSSASCSAVTDASAQNILSTISGSTLTVPAGSVSGGSTGLTPSTSGGSSSSAGNTTSKTSTRPRTTAVPHGTAASPASTSAGTSSTSSSSTISDSTTGTDNSGLSGQSQEQGTGIAITIKVTDNKQKPLKNARVILGDTSAVSDSQGQAGFKNVTAGSHNIVIKVGHKTTKRTIQVASDGTEMQFNLVAARDTSTTVIATSGLMAAAVIAVFLMAPRLFGLRRLATLRLKNAYVSTDAKAPVIVSTPVASNTPVKPTEPIMPIISSKPAAPPVPQSPATPKPMKKPDLPPGTIVPPEEVSPEDVPQEQPK